MFKCIIVYDPSTIYMHFDSIQQFYFFLLDIVVFEFFTSLSNEFKNFFVSFFLHQIVFHAFGLPVF